MMGRKRLLSLEGLQKINHEVKKSAMRLDAIHSDEFVPMVQRQILSERGFNEHADPSTAIVSSRTSRRYKIDAKVNTQSGEIKAINRVEQFVNIRNAISACAGLSSLAKSVDNELFFSSDKCGLKLNGWDEKPKLITTKECTEWLKNNHVGLSAREASLKQRMVQFNGTFQGKVGRLPCSIMEFSDTNFPDTLKLKPKITCMNSATGFYIALYHPDLDESQLEYSIYTLCIIPCVLRVQAAVIARDIGGLYQAEEFSSQEDARVRNPPATVEEGIAYYIYDIYQ